MNDMQKNMDELVSLLSRHAVKDGVTNTPLPSLFLFRESEVQDFSPRLYDSYLIIMPQGEKQLEVNDKHYAYNAGHFLTVLAPMPVICKVIEASKEKPLLAMTILLDRQRILNMLRRMEQVEDVAMVPPENVDPTGIFTAPMNAHILDAALRLVKTLDCPVEASVLGESIIDEMYFRILKQERGGSLPHLLQQRGQIQQIARAVEHVHENLSEMVSVEEMASLVNMSHSAFHKKFKEVMHLSPLQYAKQVKLTTAQLHIQAGMSVSEAAYEVGYNNPPQFSREYKRHFGVSPSAERVS